MKYTLIPGQPHTASEEETMSMIRSVLTDEGGPSKPQPRKTKAIQKVAQRGGIGQHAADRTDAPRAFDQRASEAAPHRRATDLPELAPDVQVQKRARIFRPLANVIAQVRGFQPRTRHVALASAALLFVLRPHWFVIGAAIALALVAGAFLTLGTDRIWTAIMGWLNQVEAKDTARAEELRVKLDAFAYRWDSVLDLFPDGMVDGLYMPDFQALQMAEAEHQEVVADRLHRMAQES
ncbi:hypothetical protein [uncultured Tateyamaria sp.]|uniref:hypothetical protein n=1 Tax=uncultured Tateyamaria sp. TaxID=455651 RepID=UPI00262823E2|nr:hypothetical protein [uncultured Tateyamaria sp.]